MIRTLRLQHMGIKVRDLDRSIHFYHEFLGFQLRALHEPGTHPDAPFESAFMYLDDYHHQLAIFSVPKDWMEVEGKDTCRRHDVGLHHLAFEVNDQKAFDDAVAFLRSHLDVRIVGSPALR